MSGLVGERGEGEGQLLLSIDRVGSFSAIRSVQSFPKLLILNVDVNAALSRGLVGNTIAVLSWEEALKQDAHLSPWVVEPPSDKSSKERRLVTLLFRFFY